METTVINGMSYEVVDRDGKRYIKKPAGGAGGGITGAVLEYIGPTPVPAPTAPLTTTITVPVADAQAIEAAVAKAEADAAQPSE